MKTRKGGVKLSILADVMILSFQNSKEPTRKFLVLLITSHKLEHTKSLTFLYTNNKQSDLKKKRMGKTPQNRLKIPGEKKPHQKTCNNKDYKILGRGLER